MKLTKNIKILLLNYEFPPLGGGAGNATYYLLKEFAKREDIEVDLVTSSTGEFKKEKFAKNINIYFLNIGKKGDLHYQSIKDLLVYSMQAVRFSKKLVRQNNYKLIHTFFGIPCGFIALFLGRPFIVSLRGSDVPFYSEKFKCLDLFVFQWLNKIIWKKALKIIANSTDLKKLAYKTYSKKEIEVIFNGVDLNEFQANPKKTKNFRIISTSRLIKRKGIIYLIKAVEDLVPKYPQVRLSLFGGGDQKGDLEKYVAEKKLEKNIIFYGPIDHAKIINEYENYDVFVLPSFNEGMSNSLLEGLASGLALISTNTGGARDLIDGSNGIIIRMGSVEEIKKALEDLLQNKEKLKSMKKSSRQKARDFTWGKIADKYLSIYEHA